MNKYATTAAVALVGLVALVLTVALWPIDVVTRTPATVVNLTASTASRPVINLTGPVSYDSAGQMLLPGMAQTPVEGRVTLVEAIFHDLHPNDEVLLRSDVYQPTDTAAGVAQRQQAELVQMETAATVAALRQLEDDRGPGYGPALVQEYALVESVSTGGPADGKLAVGDRLLRIGDQPVTTVAQAIETVRTNNSVGTNLPVTV
ncbi:MAG: PDZ domain-containing protein, partial [Propionibacteriaceae bacterium]|nr:PDZ domain-containing protein [Propionibacteriaceae bacterium]